MPSTTAFALRSSPGRNKPVIGCPRAMAPAREPANCLCGRFSGTRPPAGAVHLLHHRPVLRHGGEADRLTPAIDVGLVFDGFRLQPAAYVAELRAIDLLLFLGHPHPIGQIGHMLGGRLAGAGPPRLSAPGTASETHGRGRRAAPAARRPVRRPCPPAQSPASRNGRRSLSCGPCCGGRFPAMRRPADSPRPSRSPDRFLGAPADT